MTDTELNDAGQFEDAPEDNNDSVISSNNTDIKITEQINKFKAEISDVDDDGDEEEEEQFDSDYGDDDDLKPEHKGPNSQVIGQKLNKFLFN